MGESQSEAVGAAGDDSTQHDQAIDRKRREALVRLAKYTAPAMLALLASREGAEAGGIPISRLSDVRLKRDIAPVGQCANGIMLYRYRYLWSDTVQVGVMAQEVATVRPDAVRRGDDGYLRVDYAALGLRTQTWDAWAAAQ